MILKFDNHHKNYRFEMIRNQFIRKKKQERGEKNFLKFRKSHYICIRN